MNNDPDNEECVEKLIAHAQDEKERIEQEKIARKNGGVVKPKKVDEWRTKDVTERLKHALIKGIVDYIDKDTEEAR